MEHIQISWVGYALFLTLVISLLAFDLILFRKQDQVMTMPKAIGWTFFWISLGLFFNGFVWYSYVKEKAFEFLTGYVIEYSLSVDNLFIFLLIFNYFSVPTKYQHRVLFWGILGALVMRGLMIGLGSAILMKFHWLLYLFGLFLLITGIKLFFKSEEEHNPGNNPLLRIFRRCFPLTPDYHGDRFFVRVKRVWHATPLMMVLVCVEFTDLVFAVDSIPAIFGITRDPFIVFTSNIFAILGLRSLYFVLSNVMGLFHYLKYGLGCILSFVGLKMLIAETAYAISTTLSLTVVVSILTVSILASLIKHKRKPS
jgi:tellurite resistance protein TerC